MSEQVNLGGAQPLISVIVPVYKVEKYLRRCVDSILNQTYRNLEIILVDDGSPDNCGTICDEYAAKDSRIRVIHQENAGVSAARNAGLDICTGEYIAFVDSDDCIVLEMYEIMLATLSEKNVDLCVCQWQYEYTDGRHPITQKHIDQTIYDVRTSHELARYFYKGPYECGTVVASWNKLYKKSLVNTMRFSGRFMEDQFFAAQLCSKKYCVAVIPDLLYIYTENPDSLTKDTFGQKDLKFLDVLQIRYQLYQDDPFMYHESLIRYANIYVEYYYKSKQLGLIMPGRKYFLYCVWKLICDRSCKLKFYIRMLLFILSPVLYDVLLVRTHTRKTCE